MLALLLLLLAQEPCTDRRPGLSQCVKYGARDGGGVTCKAVCYTPSKTKKDGGTDGQTLNAEGATEAECLKRLKDRCPP